MLGKPVGSDLLGAARAKMPRRAWGVVLVVGLVLYLMPSVLLRYTPNTWLIGDGGFYLNMQKSLTQSGTLDQTNLHPHSWYSGKRDISDAFSNIALGSDGEWWPKHSYLMPIAALPFYWVFGVDGTLVFNVVMILSMLVLAYHLARRFAPPGLAAAASFLVGVAGPYQEYAYNYSNDGFYTVLLLAALLATIHRKNRLAGVIYGFACWAKITCVLFAPIFLAVLLMRMDDEEQDAFKERFRGVLAFGIASVGPILLYGLANWWMFGKPWVTSYERVLVVSSGALHTASHTNLFTIPMADGLDAMLFRERHGLLTAYPATLVVWLGFLPLIAARRTRVLALTTMAVFVGFVLFFARFKYYHERFLFPCFGILVIPAAVLLDTFSAQARSMLQSPRRLFILAATLLSFFVAWRVSSVAKSAQHYQLSKHIEQAFVELGDTQCDYFNNMRWSWECAKSRGDIEFVGVNAAQKHRFGGKEVEGMILAAGHHSKKPRRITFREVPMGTELVLRYGLDDKSRPPFDTEFIVTSGSAELHRIRLRKAGELHQTSLDTTEWIGQTRDVVVEVRSRDGHKSRFVFDGWVQ